MKRLGKLTAIGVLAFAAAGCGSASGGGDDGSGGSGGSSSASESGGEVQVAATMSVLQDMTEQVGGERVEVSTIAPVGATVETFQPSPSDAQKISEADLVVENGTGLESWLDDLVESAGGSDKPVATLSEDLEPIEGGEDSHEEHSEDEHSEDENDQAGKTHSEEEHSEEEHSEGGHSEEEHSEEEHSEEEHSEEEHSEEEHSEEGGSGDGHGHVHAGGNPHFWLDVENAEHYVEEIRDSLIEADPEGEEQYRQNAEEYLAELEELDGYIEQQARQIPEENRKLVTAHDAFPYFAGAYGFELSGVVIQNPDAEPGSREVAEIVEDVEEEEVQAVFTEPQFNSGLADTIADEAGVEVAELYSDTLVEDDAGDSYVDMMRTNIDRISQALG